MGNNYNVPIQGSYSESTRTKLTPDVKFTSNELLQIINSQTSAKAIADKEAKDKTIRLSKSESAYQKRIKTGIQSSQELADETGAIGDKISLKNLPIVGKHIPEILDVTGMFGNMASGLGRIPLNVEKGDYGQAALSIATPLTVGALAGIGTQNTGQFVNNIVNPLAGVKNPLSKKSINTFKPQFESEINWGQWNKEIPNNPQLMKEYNSIEQTSKANGNWMKNPDGSAFQGTPEQFVQQNSENFKKAFGNSKLVNSDGSPTIQYHGSAKKFDTFDENKFQLGDSGYSGQGIYTTPSKTTANSYATSSAKFHKGDIEPTVYELYGQANNPISSSQLIKENKGRDLFNFHRKKNWKGDLTAEESLMDYDAAIADQLPNVESIRPWNDAREIVFPTNKQLKSAIGNNGMFNMNNPNIYKTIVGGLATGTLGKQAMENKELGGYVRTSKSGRKFTYPSFEGQKQEIINRILTK